MTINMLDELNQEEVSLMTRIEKITGSFEQKVEKLRNSDILRQYQNIYKGYSDFYTESNNLEALKRIIFLQWYGISEPVVFTGIGELDEKLQKVNLNSLRKLIIENSIDQEFETMILHYFTISNWYFDSDFENIMSTTLMKRDNTLFPTNFENRGQMGKYWGSLD